MRNDIRLIDIVVYAGRLKDVDDLKKFIRGAVLTSNCITCYADYSERRAA